MDNEIKNHTILLIDDEPDILDFLSYSLKKEGFKVLIANNGEEGIRIAKVQNPSLIILDVMMPVMDGIEACQLLRKELDYRPIITFLTSRSEDYSQIAGLDAGADDYISKPIRPRLLVTKVNSLLKRIEASNNTTPVVESSSLHIDKEKYLVESSKGKLLLPKKEFELLSFLVSKPGKVFSRDEIMTNIWGEDTVVGERTVDVHIRKLREKLGNDYIRTIKGVGYTFKEI